MLTTRMTADTSVRRQIKQWVQSIYATSERNFSKMKLIKTPICSTMSHERLNHFMIFSTHEEKVDELNLTKSATKF